MFRYKLHPGDGSDAGDAPYSVVIRPGDEIVAVRNQRFRVVDLVPIEEEDSPFVGLLTVQAI